MALDAVERKASWLARQAGVTPAYVSRLLSGGKKNPSAEVLSKLADALGVSVAWLMTGQGEMMAEGAVMREDAADYSPPSANDLTALADRAQRLASEMTQLALQIRQAAARGEDKADEDIQSLPDPGEEEVLTFPAPFYGAVAAGEPVEAPLDDKVMIDEECPPGHFVVEVNGVSMEPTLMGGDRILCDGRDKFIPKNGAICIVSDGSGSSVKRWNRRKNAFESDNPNKPDLVSSEGLELQGYFVKRVTVSK